MVWGGLVAPSGMTLPPGLYKSTSGMAVTGELVLDGEGDQDAVWIFQMASTFISVANTKIILVNGAKASNIFWQVREATHVCTLAKPNSTQLSPVQSQITRLLPLRLWYVKGLQTAQCMVVTLFDSARSLRSETLTPATWRGVVRWALPVRSGFTARLRGL